MQKQEEIAIQRGILTEDERLSGHMKESWENGDFWVCYAARWSWAFGMIYYWAKIDRKLFRAGDLEDRVGLLTPEERLVVRIELNLKHDVERHSESIESLTHEQHDSTYASVAKNSNFEQKSNTKAALAGI